MGERPRPDAGSTSGIADVTGAADGGGMIGISLV